MKVALLCRLERAPTFLVPINPPFADYSRHLSVRVVSIIILIKLWLLNYMAMHKFVQRENNGYIMGVHSTHYSESKGFTFCVDMTLGLCACLRYQACAGYFSDAAPQFG